MDETLSIIIPAWNEQKVILETSEFLRRLKLPFKYSELIFVAGGTDNTYIICREIKLNNFNKVFTLKQNPGDFKSGALIKGIKKAKGDYISLIDADTIVSSNFAIEIVKFLKKFDAVGCDYLPKIQKGFIYNHHIINKLIWASNPNNLSSLLGAATISLKREIINEIGVENFFTNKSTAGVDYYMSMVLKKNNKKLGFVNTACVITPRLDNTRFLLKSTNRWYSAFYDLHKDNKRIIIIEMFLGAILVLFPPIIFLYVLNKMMKIPNKKYLKNKHIFTMFFFEFFENLQKVRTFLGKLTKKVETIGHFKGSRY